MNVYLGDRTADTVITYFNAAGNDIIKKFLPQKAKTVEKALEDYEQSLLPDAKSYGRTIWAENKYIGDIWCYCIDFNETPNAMISYCIFNTDYWGKGVMTTALKLFLKEIYDRYGFKTVGAFTYMENVSSVRVLEKCGFNCLEKISEEGIISGYYQRYLSQENHMELSQFFRSVVDQDRCGVVICNLRHEIIYMNPAAVNRYFKWGGAELIGKNLLSCHNKKSAEMIKRIVGWFGEGRENNMVYTAHNEKENKDVYMVALRGDDGELIGYYEKHEYRDREKMEPYRFE